MVTKNRLKSTVFYKMTERQEYLRESMNRVSAEQSLQIAHHRAEIDHAHSINQQSKSTCNTSEKYTSNRDLRDFKRPSFLDVAASPPSEGSLARSLAHSAGERKLVTFLYICSNIFIRPVWLRRTSTFGSTTTC